MSVLMEGNSLTHYNIHVNYDITTSTSTIMNLEFFGCHDVGLSLVRTLFCSHQSSVRVLLLTNFLSHYFYAIKYTILIIPFITLKDL